MITVKYHIRLAVTREFYFFLCQALAFTETGVTLKNQYLTSCVYPVYTHKMHFTVFENYF